jgi:uncharacterized membrane protein YraQ (UPF0718 family)
LIKYDHCILILSFFFFSVLFFLFYLAFGASIFSAIESPIEKQEVQRLIDKKKDFLKEHPCITGTLSSMYQNLKIEFEGQLHNHSGAKGHRQPLNQH